MAPRTPARSFDSVVMTGMHPIFAQAIAPFLIAPPKSHDAVVMDNAPFIQSPKTRAIRKSTDTFNYCLAGVDLVCELDYERASGDGWNEPREPECAYLCEAFCGDTDIIEILSDEQREEIEIAYLEQDRSDV